MIEPGNDKLTYSVQEASVKLGISRNSLYEAVRKKQIPFIRIGGRILISRSGLETMLAKTEN